MRGRVGRVRKGTHPRSESGRIGVVEPDVGKEVSSGGKTQDFDVTQRALSVSGSSRRWSTMWSSICGGREGDIVVRAKVVIQTERPLPPPSSFITVSVSNDGTHP